MSSPPAERHDPSSEADVSPSEPDHARPDAVAGLVGRADRLIERLGQVQLSTWVTWLIVGGSVIFTILQLQPRLIAANTTPAGGDMGAHVWAPAYLRDHLLPDLRLTGWSPDWYAGLPVMQFYMVPPMLAIVLLDVVLPYGVAFKLVAVSGVVTLPVAVWLFGRLAGLAHPAPAVLAVGSVGFLFDRTYSILGGNIPSTLAGEFAFSISLTLAVVYLALVANGLQTGRHRALAAVVIGFVALTHVIPLFFAMVGTFVLLALYPSKPGLRWIATSAPVGALLAMWWLLPFWGQRTFMNDMGWEKKYPPADAGVMEEIGFWLTRVFPQEARWVAYVAIIGVIAALVRRSAPAMFLIAMALIASVGFVVAPQGRLWNERLLPFVHLCTYLLAAFGAAELVRWVAASTRSQLRAWVSAGGAVLVAAVGIAMVAFPLHALPFGQERDGIYRWPVPPVIGTAWPFSFETTDSSYVPSWARWNFSGYERKDAWPEYRDMVLTMANLGERRGCGRALWEYNRSELDRYGTPMAPMLLPMWTDGCIASMEGLYFESSMTTPYHFLAQSSLSESPSRAQRGMPYRDFDIGLGAEQLQLMGVRYYMALSDLATNAAEGHPDLTEIARSGPWVIFEVAGAPLVEGLEHEPVVLDEVGDAGHDWVPPTADWFQTPGRWEVLLASDGPDSWQRSDTPDEAARRPLPAVEVSGIESGDDWVRFEVSEPGTPVLVKVSYFPNWRATGAEGPWRVSPNLMVVIPTDTSVELEYGRSMVEIAGWGLTGVGIVLVVLLARAGPLAMPIWTRDEEDRDEEEGAGEEDDEDDDGSESLVDPVTPRA
ncbi:MAG: hypothetical protein ACLFRV_06690 [Acidimicrobiales bacterium]